MTSFNDTGYEDLLARLRVDLQLDATTDILPGTVFQAFQNDTGPYGSITQADAQDTGELTLGAGWSYLADTGWTVMCVRDALNRVHMRGLVSKTTSWAYGETFATAPEGFRPEYKEMFHPVCFDATSGYFGARLDVWPNGTMTLVASTSNAPSGNALSFLSLSGVSYFAS